MIDTDKYEAHSPEPWHIIMPKMPYDGGIKIAYESVDYDQWTRPVFEYATIATIIRSQKHDAQLIADAPLLLAEVKRLRGIAKTCLEAIEAGGDMRSGTIELIEHNLKLMEMIE